LWGRPPLYNRDTKHPYDCFSRSNVVVSFGGTIDLLSRIPDSGIADDQILPVRSLAAGGLH